MGVSWQRFTKAFSASMLLTGMMSVAILQGGVALAVPMGGVGGFTVTFDSLEGQNMQMYPTVANNSECDAYPSLVTTISSGEISGLELYKDIGIPGTSDEMRVVMESDDVEFTGLRQRFTYLNGNFTFDEGQTISQEPGGDVEDQFTLSADRIRIDGSKINTQSQYLRTVTLADLSVYVELNPEDDVDLRNTECAEPA